MIKIGRIFIILTRNPLLKSLIITDLGGCFLITTESRGGGTESHRVFTVFTAVHSGFTVAFCGIYGHVMVQDWLP